MSKNLIDKLNIISISITVHYEYKQPSIGIIVNNDTFEDETSILISSDEVNSDNGEIKLEFDSLQDAADFGKFITNCVNDTIKKLKTIS